MSESEQIKCDFLRKRMIDLREANSKSQSEMADIIYCNKSTLSRAEKIGGNTKPCEALPKDIGKHCTIQKEYLREVAHWTEISS